MRKLTQAGSLGDSDFTELHETVLRSEHTTNLSMVIKKLVTTSIMIDDVDSFKRTALSWAAARTDFKAVEILLEYGASPNTQDILGRTPLHHAAIAKSSSESIICLSLLLKYGADANCIDIDQRTPIYAASKQPNTSTLALLLPHTDLHHLDVLGRSPLHHAQDFGYEDSVTEVLIYNGYIIDQVDKKGITPLQVAIGDNRHETIRVLLDNGADCRKTDNQEWGLFHFAASYANMKSLRELSRKPLHSVDIYATNKHGKTAQELFDGRELEPTPELREFWQDLLAQVEESWEREKTCEMPQSLGDGVDSEWGSSSGHESHYHYEDAVEEFA
jgi:ankyrin repeat protein